MKGSPGCFPVLAIAHWSIRGLSCHRILSAALGFEGGGTKPRVAYDKSSSNSYQVGFIGPYCRTVNICYLLPQSFHHHRFRKRRCGQGNCSSRLPAHSRSSEKLRFPGWVYRLVRSQTCMTQPGGHQVPFGATLYLLRGRASGADGPLCVSRWQRRKRITQTSRQCWTWSCRHTRN